MMVIIGYDDEKKEFIVNDPGDRVAGPGHRYSYDILINSLHDFIFADKKADGPARVIFTYPKLVKTADSPKIFYLTGETKRYITSPEVFKEKGWSWQAVNVVSSIWLEKFSVGEAFVY
jgi:hypothetical protein